MHPLLTSVPNWAWWATLPIAAYLLGAVPTGYLLVKARTGQDIRTVGSGSTGATNVKRVLGSKAAILVMVADMLKAVLPLVAVRYFLPEFTWLHVVMAFCAIFGHSRSVFLGFTGGKSAATGLGTLLALTPVVGGILAVVAITVFKFTRTVSIASMSAALTAPVLLILLPNPTAYEVYAATAALYVIYLHRDNIKRLLQGTENRLT